MQFLGREFELLETMRTFAHEMHEAVQGTPTAKELEELFNREPPSEIQSKLPRRPGSAIRRCFHADHHIVAGLQKARRLARKPDPGGVPVDTTSPGSSVKTLDKIRHQLRDLENQLARVGVLQHFAVDGQADVERVRIRRFRPRSQCAGPWARKYRRSCPSAIAWWPSENRAR